MRGVLLCGGEGTRLRPLTEVVNKHLVRVGSLPMAEHPLRKLKAAGVDDVVIISGGENFAAVVKYFGSGTKWGMRFMHAIQDKPGGIAQALGLAEPFIGYHKMVVILGDNLFSMDLKQSLEEFQHSDAESAQLYTIQSDEPSRFGVFQYQHNVPVRILEKPAAPPSRQICTGIYCYSGAVFDIIRGLKPSARGELEITDVNNVYLANQKARVVPMDGWWSDCGSLDTLRSAEKLLDD